MRKSRLFNYLITAISCLLAANLVAQDDIILDPAALIPADTGYYVGGVEKDKNQDGINEFYNECDDEYGDASHNESSVQQGFTYNRCMIMPTCWPKDCVIDTTNAVTNFAKGYIQLTKTKYVNTDSAVMGYIITPSIENLVSMKLIISPDVTANSDRHIYYWIEYSKDNGATWEDAQVVDEYLDTEHKYDEEHVYDNTNSEFKKMIDASKTGSIVLRIMTKPQIQIGTNIPDYYSQRLKVHYVHIVADQVNTSAQKIYNEIPVVQVIDNMISCEDKKITVFNTLGQYMGSGNNVSVKQGIYIIRFENGFTQKIFVH